MANTVVIMFGGECHYGDASRLMWRNIRFETDERAFEITLNKCKSSQFRQESNILVAAFPPATLCPVRPLQRLRVYTGGAEGLYVFHGFNINLISKITGSSVPGTKNISYYNL